MLCPIWGIRYGKPMARLDEWATAIKKNMGSQELRFITGSGQRPMAL